MGLLEEVCEAQRERSRGPKCSVGLIVAEMGEDGQELEDMLDKRGREEIDVHYTAIAAVLKKRGHPIGTQPLGRHATKICGCFK